MLLVVACKMWFAYYYIGTNTKYKPIEPVFNKYRTLFIISNFANLEFLFNDYWVTTKNHSENIGRHR